MAAKDDLLQEFDHEMENTRKLLERVPDGNFSWKPHPKSGDLGWLANHVATLPDFGAVILKQDAFDFDGAPRRTPATTRKALLELFEQCNSEARVHLEKMTDEALAKNWTLSYKKQLLFAMPRKMAYRGPFLNHMIHHRAQLTVYLRLNNVPLPSIYGPTADEPFQPS